jgi:hypothetical protein
MMLAWQLALLRGLFAELSLLVLDLRHFLSVRNHLSQHNKSNYLSCENNCGFHQLQIQQEFAQKVVE